MSVRTADPGPGAESQGPLTPQAPVLGHRRPCPGVLPPCWPQEGPPGDHPDPLERKAKLLGRNANAFWDPLGEQTSRLLLGRSVRVTARGGDAGSLKGQLPLRPQSGPQGTLPSAAGAPNGSKSTPRQKFYIRPPNLKHAQEFKFFFFFFFLILCKE